MKRRRRRIGGWSGLWPRCCWWCVRRTLADQQGRGERPGERQQTAAKPQRSPRAAGARSTRRPGRQTRQFRCLRRRSGALTARDGALRRGAPGPSRSRRPERRRSRHRRGQRRTRKGNRECAKPMRSGGDRADGETTHQPGAAGSRQIRPSRQQCADQVAEEVGGGDQAGGGSAETQRRDHGGQDRRVDEAADAERGGQCDQAAEARWNGLGRERSSGWLNLVLLHVGAHMSRAQFQEAI